MGWPCGGRGCGGWDGCLLVQQWKADKADKLASLLSLFVAAAAGRAVPVAFLGSVLFRSGSVQSVANTVVGSHLTQMRDVEGVRVKGPVTALPPVTAPPPQTAPPQTAPPGAVSPPDSRGGQYVNGVWVGGC